MTGQKLFENDLSHSHTGRSESPTPKTMWFEQLTGFPEESPAQVRQNLAVSDGNLISRVNGKSWTYGELEVISLADLRKRVSKLPGPAGGLTVKEVVADVRELHLDEDNAGSLFQVASQFNLLEMVGPGVTPEQGVGIYEKDFTQGPACAIAAGAGTIYRNYFAEVNGQTGQSEANQLDCLAGIGELLGNTGDRLWRMRNGYALASEEGLQKISGRLRKTGPEELDALRGALRVGIQWGTQVTLQGATHLVSQVYCSALPAAYSHCDEGLWKEFAVLVLEAAYEATLCAGILNAHERGNNRVFLTQLGGGAFGNDPDWIIGAMGRAFEIHRDARINVRIVSYGASDPRIRGLISET